MRGLTNSQVAMVGWAAALMRLHGDVISEFERELIVEVCKRFLAAGRAAVITEAEWLAVEPAVGAMERALIQPFDAPARTNAQTRTRAA